MTDDPFTSAKRRLARAKEHAANVISGIQAFFDTQPYTKAFERNARGFEEHKVKLTRPIPEQITDIAYEALEAMRASLDHATYAVAIACGAKRPDLIHFPVADTTPDFENILNGRLKDFPPDILSLFRSVKPYQHGNVTVWALNQVRRQSTHRLIVPIGTAMAGAFVRHVSMTRPYPLNVFTHPQWDSEKDEMVFIVTGPGADLDYDINIAFTVVFGPVEGIAGLPVGNTLDGMTNEVERILVGIEAEYRRLGLAPPA